jgi:hypothetical protein
MQIGSLPLGDGDGLVLFEVEEADEPGPRPVSDEARSVRSFEEALERVRPAVGRVLETLQELRPGAIEVEFGLKLSGQAGAVFARVASEGHFRVKATWPGAMGPVAPG